MNASRAVLRVVAGLLVVVAGTIACTPSSSQSVSKHVHPEEVAGALRATGDGLLVLTQDPVDGALGEYSRELVEIVVNADATFGEPTLIADGLLAADPRVVVADAGRARVAWRSADFDTDQVGRVQCCARRSDGSWEQPPKTFPQTSIDYGSHGLAGDAAGHGLLVYAADGVVYIALADVDLPFADSELLFGGSPSIGTEPVVAMNARGDGVVACLADQGDGVVTVEAWALDLSLGLVPLGRVDDSGAARDLRVAVADDGTRAFAWHGTLSPGVDELLVRRLDQSGGWSPIESVIVEGADPDAFIYRDPILARFDGSGALIVCWIGIDLGIAWCRSPTPGVFDPIVATGIKAAAEYAPYFDLAIDGSGRITCVGVTPDGFDYDLVARRTRVDGSHSAVRSLLAADTPRTIDVKPTLLAGGPLTLAVYTVGTEELRASLLDANAMLDPVANWTVAPETPTAGVAANFDAFRTSRARATGAELTDAVWDFDADGTFESTGFTANVNFTAAGTYPVTVRVTDSWGDSAIATKTVTVVDGGGGGGPDIDPPWELTVTLAGSGAVTADYDGDGNNEIDCPNVCIASYPHDSYVYLAATPATGFHLDHWEGDVIGDPGELVVLVHMTADRAITAIFAAD